MDPPELIFDMTTCGGTVVGEQSSWLTAVDDRCSDDVLHQPQPSTG